MMFSAVAWDVDGTLVDSEPLHLAALHGVSRAAGVDLGDLDEDHFIGMHLSAVWDALAPRYGARLSKEGWLDGLARYYRENIAMVRPMEGAIETVRALAAAGIPQAAVSNSGRAVVDANLTRLGVADLFAFSLSLDDVSAPKPDPAPYRRAAERFGLDPARVLAVEDSETGARSGAAAGLKVAFVGGAAPAFADYPLTRLADITRIVRG